MQTCSFRASANTPGLAGHHISTLSYLLWTESPFIGSHPVHYPDQPLIQTLNCLTWVKGRARAGLHLPINDLSQQWQLGWGSSQPTFLSNFSQLFYVGVKTLRSPEGFHNPTTMRQRVIPPYHLLEIVILNRRGTALKQYPQNPTFDNQDPMVKGKTDRTALPIFLQHKVIPTRQPKTIS